MSRIISLIAYGQRKHITITVGETVTIEASCFDEDQVTPLDLTGKHVVATIRPSTADGAVDDEAPLKLKKDATITANLATVTFSSAETFGVGDGGFSWDLWNVDDGRPLILESTWWQRQSVHQPTD